jgi:ABC-type Fe3+/spermidine/putrescine transport system ATPase subunit
MPTLKLIEVSKRFGRVKALEGVTFDVKDGEYLCVLGPTGSGKTTLLRLISGILRHDEGEININGRPAITVAVEDRNSVYVPQNYALFPHMNVLENVMYGPLAKGVPKQDSRETALRLLRMVRLESRVDALPNQLSGGMQQRVALARGLASGADLLLLDEPLGALDARLRIELRRELRDLVKESGATVIHVTHDQEEAMSVGDRVLVLRGGRVQQHGTPFHVYASPGNIFAASFIGSSNFLEGVVTQRDRESSTVRLRENLNITVSDTSHELEEPVIVAIREEKTEVQPGPPKSRGAFLLGEVSAVQFLGSFVRYEVTLDNGDHMAAKTPIGRLKRRLEMGERVTVVYDPRKTLVYDYPTLGLRHELEVY